MSRLQMTAGARNPGMLCRGALQSASSNGGACLSTLFSIEEKTQIVHTGRWLSEPLRASSLRKHSGRLLIRTLPLFSATWSSAKARSSRCAQLSDGYFSPCSMSSFFLSFFPFLPVFPLCSTSFIVYPSLYIIECVFYLRDTARSGRAHLTSTTRSRGKQWLRSSASSTSAGGPPPARNISAVSAHGELILLRQKIDFENAHCSPRSLSTALSEIQPFFL
jgi:hypothetical protein